MGKSANNKLIIFGIISHVTSMTLIIAGCFIVLGLIGAITDAGLLVLIFSILAVEAVLGFFSFRYFKKEEFFVAAFIHLAASLFTIPLTLAFSAGYGIALLLGNRNSKVK